MGLEEISDRYRVIIGCEACDTLQININFRSTTIYSTIEGNCVNCGSGKVYIIAANLADSEFDVAADWTKEYFSNSWKPLPKDKCDISLDGKLYSFAKNQKDYKERAEILHAAIKKFKINENSLHGMKEHIITKKELLGN